MTETAAPILCATDLSERSDRAMRRAVLLARDLGAPLELVTVVDDAMPDDMAQALADKAQARLDRFAGAFCSDMAVTCRVLTGDPTTALLSEVQTVGAVLLVVGTHRPRPFLDGIRETTVMRVVRRASCPVLVVRDPDDHAYATVLVATDFSPSATAAANLAHRLAPGAALHAIHALHVPYSGMLAPGHGAADVLQASFQAEAQAQSARWQAALADSLPLGPTELVPGPAFATIHAAQDRLGADLIAVGAHGRAGAAPAILGSLANDLMRDGPCDVLIARGGA